MRLSRRLYDAGQDDLEHVMRRLLRVLYRSIPVRIAPHELHPEGFHTVSKSPSKAFCMDAMRLKPRQIPRLNSGVVTRRFPELPFKVTEEEVAPAHSGINKPKVQLQRNIDDFIVCGGKMAISIAPPSNILMAL